MKVCNKISEINIRTEKVTMRRFLIIMLTVLFSAAILWSQEEMAEAEGHAVEIAEEAGDIEPAETEGESETEHYQAEEELTEEEILCKKAAERFMQIYEDWDVSRDYEVLLPRVTSYVNSFYRSGADPDESNRSDMERLGELYSVVYPLIQDEFYKGLISDELERIENELSGNQKNPSLLGYADQMDIGRLDVIEDYLMRGANSGITASTATEIRNIYRNIRRLSIGWDEMLDRVYSETTRLTDKRLYFLYVAPEVKEGLEEIAGIIAGYVNSREDEYREMIRANIDEMYKLRREAIEAGDRDLESFYYDQWIEARKVNIDKVKTDEVVRLMSITSRYMTHPGIYDINAELINKIKTGDPELEPFFRNILRIKFYHDLHSRMRVYSRFAAERGFRTYRLNVLIGSLMFFILFFYVFITVRKKRDSIFIRRIPGLDAIDDAVGRATEMGKPIIYDSGLGAFTNPQTIASMLILRNVSKKVAEFKAEIVYPAYDPIVLQVAEEMVSSGFLDAGYPEDHKKTNCFFMVSDQFAFAAGLSGLISRLKPASAFHFGTYAAESLLIAEAGYAAGAIQVAGTVDASQLPFFITACDYTLIGEELYAAAAYLSRDAQVLSNLKLSDYGKILFGFLFLLGTILLTINAEWTWIADLLDTK